MPPVALTEVERVENVLGVPLTDHLAEQTPLPGSEVDVPDDIRSVALFAINQMLEDGNIEDHDLTETRAHLQMVHNLEQFIHGREKTMDDSELMTHQKDVFHAIYEFLRNPPLNEAGEFERKGLIKLPTGTGKTAIFTTLIDILNKPVQEDQPKLKSLVLVPKLDLVSQTVGTEDEDNQRGFARFASDTTVTEFHGQKKDLSGDAVVMTYRSFNKQVREGNLDASMFDIVVCDEAHNTLGKQVKESLQEFCQDKLVIGLTATPEYSDNKKVIDLLPHEIHSMELREAIEEGFLAPVQCLAITSDEEITTLSRGSLDYTEKELEKLIESEWRNQKAVEFAKSFIAEGKQGLVSCVPGQDLAHAKLMAERLNNESIVDPTTGEERQIRAAVVGSQTSKAERAELYKAYDRGEIDVLTYVDLLTEGWDSAAAKFIINLRPTTSPVNAVQRMGRVLRWTEDGELAVIVEFIDRSEKPQFTFYHALGIEEIELNKVYGRSSNAEGGGGEQPGGLDLAGLPEDLRALLGAVDHRLVGELIIQPEVYRLPEGVVSIKSFSESLGVGPKAIVNIIEELGLDVGIYRFGNNSAEGYGLTVDQQELIKCHEFFDIKLADETVKSIFAFSEDEGLGRTAVKNAIDALELEVGIYRFGNNMQGHPALSEAQQQQVVEYLANRAPDMSDEIIGLSSFTKANNTSNEMARAVAEELGIEIATFRDARGHLIPALTAEQASRILQHPHYQTSELSEDHVRATDLMAELRMQTRKLSAIMEEVGVQLGEYRLPGAGARVKALTSQQAQLVRDYVSEHMPSPPEGYQSITEFARIHGLNSKQVEAAAAELGISLKAYRFVAKKGARMAIGIGPEDVEAILEQPAVNKRQQAQSRTAESPESGVISTFMLAKQLGISEGRLSEIISDQSIQTNSYLFSGNLGAGITIEDATKVQQHPYFQIPVSSPEDISINQAARALGVDPPRLRRIIARDNLATRALRNSRGRVVDHLTIEQIEMMRREVEG